jgi:[acyl-carrier-protein] S-malonyltransferase
VAVALLFPGQGAQAIGMATALVQRSSIAADLFARASSILGYDLLDVCNNGPADRLNATDCSQPALYVHSIAVLETLKVERSEVFENVQAVAGLSLGEYSALTAAGSLSFEDGVRVVQARGRAMQDAATKQPSGMASVLGLDTDQVHALCDKARQPNEVLQVANLLCPGNIAISGHVASIEAAEQAATDAGAMKYIRLSVAGAFHTSLMQPAVEPLTKAIAGANLADATLPVYCNVDATAHQNSGDFASLLSKQVVSPVLWEQSLRNLMAAGITQFYELGAGRVLAGTLKRIDRKAQCESIA